MSLWNDHDRWAMRRAVRLATLSLGRTWPNPGVGCVLVRDGVIIGEGRHTVYGQAHAEVNAINACRQAGINPAGATAYVTLAPCTRHGRQPPCANALVAAQISRVVAAIDDVHQDDPRAFFRAAGIAYEVGCMSDMATHVHGGFLMRIALGRPRFTGKWAMSLDGNIATQTRSSGWISDPEALALSRRRRRAFDAIVVGSGTAQIDDPRLLSTVPGERSPVRIVVSRGANIPMTSQLIQSAAHNAVMVVHAHDASKEQVAALRSACVETIAVTDPHEPQQVAAALGKRGLNDVLIEGGSRIHAAWLHAGLYDRIEVYTAALTLGAGLPVCTGSGVATVQNGMRWQPEEAPRLCGNTVCWRLRRPGRIHDLAPVVVIDD